MCVVWNDSNTDLVILLIAAVCYVWRCYGLQSGSQWMECIKWNKLCEFRLDSYNLLILTWTCVWFWITALLTRLCCSLIQYNMFEGATNFDQDISGWDVSSGINFVSLGWILVLIICSFLLEHVCGFGMTALLTCYFVHCYRILCSGLLPTSIRTSACGMYQVEETLWVEAGLL